MLFKFSKYFQLIYSPLLLSLILFLDSFVNSNPTDDEKFIEMCKRVSEELKSRIELSPAPAPSTTTLTYLDHPLVVSKEEFNQWFIMEEMKFLAEEMYKIIKKPWDKFDNAVIFAKNVLTKGDKYSDKNVLRKGDKYSEKYIKNWKNILDENPREFFPNLDKFLWNMDDKNSEKIEKENCQVLMKYTEEKLLPPLVEYEGSTTHSMVKEVAIYAEEYVEARKIINEYIKKIKIEIVYGQGIGAINQIGHMHSTIKNELKKKFDEIHMEVTKFVHKKTLKISKLKENIHGKIKNLKMKGDEKSEDIREIMKEKNLMERRKKLKKKFTKKEKKKDIPHKYKELYLYNLLNNATIILFHNLKVLVAEAVIGHENGIKFEENVLALVELILKPNLREAFNEAKLTIPVSPEAMDYVESLIGIPKTELIENEPSSSSSSNTKSKKDKGKDKVNEEKYIPYKFEYDLVANIETNLGLSSKFFDLERIIVGNRVGGMIARKSKIRIGAAKLLIVYERLKKMYYGKRELTDDERKSEQEMIHNLSEPITIENFGELLENYFMNPPPLPKN